MVEMQPISGSWLHALCLLVRIQVKVETGLFWYGLELFGNNTDLWVHFIFIFCFPVTRDIVQKILSKKSLVACERSRFEEAVLPAGTMSIMIFFIIIHCQISYRMLWNDHTCDFSILLLSNLQRLKLLLSAPIINAFRSYMLIWEAEKQKELSFLPPVPPHPQMATAGLG